MLPSEPGFAVKIRFETPPRPLPDASYALGDMHPELVTLRFKLLDGEVARINARDRGGGEAGAGVGWPRRTHHRHTQPHQRWV